MLESPRGVVVAQSCMGAAEVGKKKTTQDSLPCPLPPIVGCFCLLDIALQRPALNSASVPYPKMTFLPAPCQDLACPSLLAGAEGQKSEKTQDKTTTTKTTRKNNSLRCLLFSRTRALLQAR